MVLIGRSRSARISSIWSVCLYLRFLFCSADPQYSSAVINTNVIVSHTGEVVWLSHGIFRSSCDINVEFFPFDEQRCVLKWASWTYDGYQVRSTSKLGSFRFSLPSVFPDESLRAVCLRRLYIRLLSSTEAWKKRGNFRRRLPKTSTRISEGRQRAISRPWNSGNGRWNTVFHAINPNETGGGAVSACWHPRETNTFSPPYILFKSFFIDSEIARLCSTHIFLSIFFLRFFFFLNGDDETRVTVSRQSNLSSLHFVPWFRIFFFFFLVHFYV